MVKKGKLRGSLLLIRVEFTRKVTEYIGIKVKVEEYFKYFEIPTDFKTLRSYFVLHIKLNGLFATSLPVNQTSASFSPKFNLGLSFLFPFLKI